MECGKCKTKMVKIELHVCPKCGKELEAFKHRVRLEREKLKYRKITVERGRSKRRKRKVK